MSRPTANAHLTAIVDELARELHPQHSRRGNASLSSRLERDLGIDSLGRTELILRLERAFGVRLPISLVGEAETVGDLSAGAGAGRPVRHADRRAAAGGAVADRRSRPPPRRRTLLEVLDWHVAQHPDRLHVTVLEDEATVHRHADLWRTRDGGARGRGRPDRARHRCRATGSRSCCRPASISSSRSSASSMPARFRCRSIRRCSARRSRTMLRRQAGILRNAGARMLITVPEGLRLGALLRGAGRRRSTRSRASRACRPHGRRSRCPTCGDGSATALIQYTSGSTGDPKGVVLSHANLLANIRAIGRAIGASSADVFVSWLPLYHDMGLIGAWLGCLYFGAPLYVMSPLSLPGAPAELAVGDPSLSRHHLRGAEFRVRALPQQDRRCRPRRDSISSSLRMVGERRRAGQRRDAAPLHRAIRALRLSAGGDGAGLRPCRKRRRPDLAAARARRRSSIASTASAAAARRRRARAGADDPNAIEIVACGQPIPGPRDPHRRRSRPRARRAAGRPARVPRSVGDLRLFPERGEDARAVPRRLARQRRPRLYGRRRSLHHRPHQGHHHPRRPAHRIRTRSRRRSARCRASARTASRSSASPIARRHRARGRARGDQRSRPCRRRRH